MQYVAAGCVAAFAVLAVLVAIDPGPLPGDRRVLLEVHDLIGDDLDEPLVRLADLTDLVPLAVAAAVLGLGLAWRRRWRDLAYGAAVVGVVWALNPVLKELFDRARPPLWPHPMTVSEYSFPSGHAANTVALAAAVALIAWSSRFQTVAVVVGALFVVVVGLGQVTLGVHYPSDILAGWAWAGAWAALLWSIRPSPEWVRPPPGPSHRPPTRGSRRWSRS